MPTYLWWALALNMAQLAVILVLICVVVHYAREGARNAGKLEIFERMEQESKTIPIGGVK